MMRWDSSMANQLMRSARSFIGCGRRSQATSGVRPVLSRRDRRSETIALIDDLESLCREEYKLDT
jgi:hypothetical protein